MFVYHKLKALPPKFHPHIISCSLPLQIKITIFKGSKGHGNNSKEYKMCEYIQSLKTQEKEPVGSHKFQGLKLERCEVPSLSTSGHGQETEPNQTRT